MNLVFFDFDDTVTMVDTTLPFGAYFARHLPSVPRALGLIAYLGLLRFRFISNLGLKRAFARRYLRGRTIPEVQRLAGQFFETSLSTLGDEAVVGALRMHADRGDRVYLVSANFECLLQPLVARWGLAGVVATVAEDRAGTFTGEIAGPALNGGEKLNAVVARFGREAVQGAVAYGNADDAPLLAAVRSGYLVRSSRPIGRRERLRQWRRTLAGTLTRSDLSPRSIEAFRRTGSAMAVPAAKS